MWYVTPKKSPRRKSPKIDHLEDEERTREKAEAFADVVMANTTWLTDDFREEIARKTWKTSSENTETKQEQSSGSFFLHQQNSTKTSKKDANRGKEVNGGRHGGNK